MLFVTYYWHGMAKSIKHIKSTFANELQSDTNKSHCLLLATHLKQYKFHESSLDSRHIDGVDVSLFSILSLWTHHKPLAWKRYFQYTPITTVSNETTEVRPVFTSIPYYYSNSLFSLQPWNFFFACRRIIFQHLPLYLLRLLREYPYLLSVPEATPAIWRDTAKRMNPSITNKANIPNNLHAYGIAFVPMLFRG